MVTTGSDGVTEAMEAKGRKAQVDVPRERRFVGLDAIDKVLATGVDAVVRWIWSAVSAVCALVAVLVASLAISAYLAVRFEWRQAIGILVSVLHDGLVAIGLLALFDIEFDLNVIAGLMAVIGYSLNDSIVISDRLRDLLGSRTQMGIHDCSDVAIKATFSRTLITSGTTLFTVGALLLFGGAALYGFAIFYASCAALTWFIYTRKGGLLHDVERGVAPSAPIAQGVPA